MVLYSVLFLILAALAPPLILMGIIYRLDQIEREPPGLLWSLFLRGVLAMVPILVLEMLADQFIDFFYWRPMVYLFLAYFVVPGFIEEGIKYRVLRRRTWNEPNFNYRFDGVVYGVFVSLGFAAVENVMYVLTSGFSTAVVPGHLLHPRPRHVRGGDGGGPGPGQVAGRPRAGAAGGCLSPPGLAAAGHPPRRV